MKPLIVLVLVLAAAAALVFGFQLLGTRRSSSDPAAPSAAGPAAPGGQGGEGAKLSTPLSPERAETPATTPEVAGEASAIQSPNRANQLTGLVVDERQQPIAGATVKLSRDPMMGESLATVFFLDRKPTGQSLSAKTDSKGVYRFNGIEPARDYYLLVSHPDFAPVQEEQIGVGEKGDASAPTVVLMPGSTLSGYVRDISGAPLAGATLHLDSAYMMGVDQRSPDRQTSASDNTGYYEFKNVAAGSRNLTCAAEGFGLQIKHNLTFKGQPGDNVEWEFRLQLGHPIAGRVLGPMNEPVPGAQITALAYGNNVSSRGEALSAEDGSFQIDGLQQGQYILTVTAAGYRQGRMNRVQAGEVNLTIEMLTKACVAGMVVDSAGKPVTSFTLTARRTGLDKVNAPAAEIPIFEQTDIAQTFSDRADGSFELCNFTQGMAYALHCTAPGFAPAQSAVFAVIENQTPNAVTLRLSRGGALKGRVVDTQGAPIAGAQISSHDTQYNEGLMDSFMGDLVTSKATERKVRTDAEGFFQLELLTPGVYKLIISHPTHTTETVKDLNVAEGAPNDVGSIALGKGGTITGRVVDQAGKPMARGFVQLIGADPTHAYSARTDGEGNYKIEHVRPGGYRLSATRSSPSGTSDPFSTILDQQHSEVSITVIEGGTVSRDLSLGS